MGQVLDSKATQIIETDEIGRLVIPAEVLGSVNPHTKYTIEAVGTKLVIEAKETVEQPKETVEEWERKWKELQDLMREVWKTDKSAAEIISEMRR